MEPGSESIKKKDKHPKEALKRSKSHTEDKHVEKPKSKPDSKDSEKEKPRTELVTQENQKPSKSSSDTDKDSRKSRETELGMKVKVMEKSRSKSREDKKAQGLEVKNKGSTSGSRPDTSKERKREGSMKEQRKDTEENPPEKMEGKSGKKMVDKKAQNPEKKDTQDERKGRKADEKSDKSSISSPAPDITEPPLKKGPQSKDTSTDWDPTDATIATSTSVTYDALSDVTPELEDDDGEMPLGEVEPRPLTTGADALLTLMDICTSADARLGQGSDITGAMKREACPELSFQEADIKMKEAALTLLSMDPESILSPTLVTPATQEVTEATTPALQRKETTTPVAKDPEDSEHVLEMDESDLTATASSEKMDDQSRSQDVLDTGVKDTVVSTWTLVEGMSQVRMAYGISVSISF
uniref:Uncharacterized protein n=1 Tax=Hucho hucho TaxID=62062 RepID=A0A4W5RTF8_9TELE